MKTSFKAFAISLLSMGIFTLGFRLGFAAEQAAARSRHVNND
jgi:hypothetical protein